MKFKFRICGFICFMYTLDVVEMNLRFYINTTLDYDSNWVNKKKSNFIWIYLETITIFFIIFFWISSVNIQSDTKMFVGYIDYSSVHITYFQVIERVYEPTCFILYFFKAGLIIIIICYLYETCYLMMLYKHSYDKKMSIIQ